MTSSDTLSMIFMFFSFPTSIQNKNSSIKSTFVLLSLSKRFLLLLSTRESRWHWIFHLLTRDHHYVSLELLFYYTRRWVNNLNYIILLFCVLSSLWSDSRRRRRRVHIVRKLKKYWSQRRRNHLLHNIKRAWNIN